MTKSPVHAIARRGAPIARGLAVATAIVLATMGATALAQDAGAAPVAGGGIAEIAIQLMPILLLVVIFWLLIFRPQQKRMKAQQAMLAAIRRGDTVVTSGGIVGKVIKAVDGEDLEVEISPNVRVKLVRGMVTDVRSKAEPVNDNAKTA